MQSPEMPPGSGYGSPRKSLKPIAFCAIAFTTVSVIACVITLPLVYNHVQRVQSYMSDEVAFCKTRSRDMWREMVQLQAATGFPEIMNNRTKRQAFEGYNADPVGSSPGANGLAGPPGSCCT
uniref:Nematode cuticle collagen N-terminal domain-containing protein n=2 Tax=Panagrolaimus superbus TaxID=310955 RepID=A0A914YJ61_9BILA